MTDDDRLLDLLVAAAESRDSGEGATVETLCRGDQELAEQLRRRLQILAEMQWLDEPDPPDDDGQSTTLISDVAAPPQAKVAAPETPGGSFRQHLLDSGLISGADLDAICAELGLDPAAREPVALARALVERRRLTRYQARYVAMGKGRRLAMGPYMILDKLGEGGVGQVFKALHQETGRLVALKVLRQSLVELPGVVERFRRETRAAARLTHPNIVTAYEAGEHDGQHFLSLELVEGENLLQFVRRQGPLSVADALNYSIQAARGLAYAHSKGVIHRDVKPANILIDGGGVVRVLDLGLARLHKAEGSVTSFATLTKEGTVLGTVDYMAPEQAESTHAADARSDVYGLGCTLFFLLTGRAPFSGDTLLARILAHRDTPVPKLVEVRPDAPPCLVALYERSLAKRPVDRFPTMAAFLEAAERCRGG